MIDWKENNQKIIKFLYTAQDKVTYSSWIDLGIGEIYLRKAIHLINDKPKIMLDVGNITLKNEFQDKGIFTKILDQLIYLRQFNGIYIENVFNPIIIPMLKRKGFSRIKNSVPICYFKLY